MKKYSRSTARSTTWSKLLAAALACWAAAARVERWGCGVVWANEVWTNRDAAQHTRKSVKSTNRERNIFVCFIRNFLFGFENSTIVHSSGSRHCEMIFIRSTPDGLPSITAQPKIAPFVAYFLQRLSFPPTR